MGILVGVLVLAVALVGGGYLLLTKEGSMKTVEEAIGPSIGMDLNEEQENLSVLDYGKSILEIFANLSDTPIKDIEATVGINKISTTISDAIGLDTAVIGESSISNLGATISNNLTMDAMSNKFEIELPEMPLFQNEEFLAKPINEAFEGLDQNTLDCFIQVVYDEDATEENPASSALMQKLGKKPLSELSEDMDAVIQDTTIGEVIEIDAESSSEVLIYLKDTKIKDLDGEIQEMTIGDAITIDENSSMVLKYLAESKLDEIDADIKVMKISNAVEIITDADVEAAAERGETLVASHAIMQAIKDFTLTDLSNSEKLQGAIDGLKLEDVMEIGDNPHAIIGAIRDLTIGELGESGKLQERINDLTLKDVVEIDETNSAKLLISLKDTKIGELSTAMDNLTLEQVMDDYNVGVLSLVSPDTKVQDIGTALSAAVTDTSLYALRQAGLFSYDLSTQYDHASLVERVYKNNSTPQEIISDFTGVGVAESDKKSITATVYLYDSTISGGDFAQNDAFYTLAMAHVGYKGALDIGEYATKSEGAYVLAPSVIDVMFTAAGLSGRHDVIFCVDDGIEILIQAPKTEVEDENGEIKEVYENYTKVFSIMYAGGQGSITFGKGLKMDTQVGGCGVYVANSITVYDAETDSYVAYDSSKALPIELRQVSKQEDVVENGETVKKAVSYANTWLAAYTAYQAIP